MRWSDQRERSSYYKKLFTKNYVFFYKNGRESVRGIVNCQKQTLKVMAVEGGMGEASNVTALQVIAYVMSLE
jgi:hypothetical protein